MAAKDKLKEAKGRRKAEKKQKAQKKNKAQKMAEKERKKEEAAKEEEKAKAWQETQEFWARMHQRYDDDGTHTLSRVERRIATHGHGYWQAWVERRAAMAGVDPWLYKLA